ncbi:MAG TPA: 16S rRNA (cytosine(1402)-N(4))-methyltransferase RsmH [Anaerolineae bacterium]|nr:16S rRNA (cytosine(1402)-N(4))-methyltransferase RsmH [Anaerolineae bacterium]
MGNIQPSNAGHIPVLYHEVLAGLNPQPDQYFIDGTLGAGGHTRALATAIAPTGRLLAFDRDAEAVRFARTQLQATSPDIIDRITFVHDHYATMAHHAAQHNFPPFHGIFLDLGLSSRQLDNPARGFSWRQDGPLDMRFDTSQGPTAGDIVNNWSAEDLADIFWRYADFAGSRRLARGLVADRPFHSTNQLADAIERHNSRGRHRQKQHPASQIFQALRIAVNDELGRLEETILTALDLLTPGGRLAIISFHSIEDRIVKLTFRRLSKACTCPPEQPICTCGGQPQAKLITRKPISASPEEIETNPRSRSAHLRILAKEPTS